MSDQISEELRKYFPKLAKVRKPHRCRLCSEIIQKGESCCLWSTLECGEGYRSWHAHPECYQLTLDNKWDGMDWECALPGDVERPRPDQ